MSRRVQVILDEEERELFREQAKADGTSLSAWLREAGRLRLERARRERLPTTADELTAFFSQCDRREEGTEPDWAEHLSVMETSKRSGETPT